MKLDVLRIVVEEVDQHRECATNWESEENETDKAWLEAVIAFELEPYE